MSKTKFVKNKKTARFNFSVARNTTSHQTGANVVTIESRDYDTSGKGYSVGTNTPTIVTMTVKEAQALNRFLTKTLS
mgnify:FL=1|jgi:hypothetical protein